MRYIFIFFFFKEEKSVLCEAGTLSVDAANGGTRARNSNLFFFFRIE